ncbi:MAG TPA: hypothetical protein VM818_14255 [Vicinamibacterales bacterium]|nr:hypothetical protein [Vicinamibacterales bacterium]
MPRFVERTTDATHKKNRRSRRPTLLPAGTWIAAAAFGVGLTVILQSQDADTRRERFTHKGGLEPEATAAPSGPALREAPTGFDNLTNGFDPQGPPYESIDEDNVAPLASFNDNRFVFEEIETIEDGLGPTYNAQGCGHQIVVTGGASQIAEHRAGRMFNGEFFESLGGSLIHSRATDAEIMHSSHSDETFVDRGTRVAQRGRETSSTMTLRLARL